MLERADEAIATYNEMLGQAPRPQGAARPRSALRRPAGVARPRRQHLPPAPARRAAARAGRAARPARAAARDAPRRGRGGGRDLPPGARSRGRTTATRSRRSSGWSRCPSTSCTIATILEPIYKARGEWHKQIGVYEIMVRHAFDPARKIELLHQIGELHEIGGDDADSAFRTYARALREDPRNEITHGQLERLARGLDKWKDAGALYDTVAEPRRRRTTSRSRCCSARAQIQEHELRDDKAAVATYERVLKAAPQHASTRPPRSRRSTSAPASGPSSSTSSSARSRSSPTSTRRSSCCIAPRRSKRRCSATPTPRSRRSAQVLSIDDVDMTRWTRSSACTSASRAGSRSRTSTRRRPTSPRTPTTRSRCSTCSRRSTTASSATSRKAIETYQAHPRSRCRRAARDPVARPALRPGRALVRPAREPGAPGRAADVDRRDRRAQVPHRPPVADPARRRRARDRELPRGARDRSARTAETLHALDGLVHGKTEPVMAARVLEPIFEAGGECDEARRRARGDGRAQRGSARARRAAAPHRAAARADDRRRRTPRSTPTRARSSDDSRQRARRSATSSGSPRSPSAWEPLAKLYEARGRQVARRAAPGRHADARSRASTSRSSATSRRRSRRIARILDVEFDNKPAVLALDRLYTQTARVARARPRSCAARSSSRTSDAEIAALQFRLGQVLETELGDRKGAVEVYREILTAQPTHAPTLAALEEMFHAGHLQIEIGGVLEPLYEAAERVGEAARDLRGPARQARPGRDRQAMYQRLAELAEDRLYDQARGVPLVERGARRGSAVGARARGERAARR